MQKPTALYLLKLIKGNYISINWNAFNTFFHLFWKDFVKKRKKIELCFCKPFYTNGSECL